MKLKINDTVKNPAHMTDEDSANHFLGDLMEATEPTATVRMIVDRDWTTEEKGFTKQVEASDNPDAFVYLAGSTVKYRLSEIEPV